MRVYRGLLSGIWYKMDTITYSLWDPELYGPRMSVFFRTLYKISIISSAFLSLLLLVLLITGRLNPLTLVLPIIISIIALKASRIWRIILGWGIDRELPAVLAYLIPYTRSSVNIADLIARLEGEGYFWVKFEASRLRFLLDLGYDPITSLKKLSETTPSRMLAEVLRDYVNVQSLGASRSQITLLLFEHAMNSLRDQWRSHIEFGRIVAEGVTAAVISMIALTPLVILGRGYPLFLVLIPLVVAPAGAIAMIATRPSLGEYRLSYFELLLTITVPIIAIILNFKVSLTAGLAYLLGMTFVVEAIAYGFNRISNTALRELRLAVEEARLGLPSEERLARSERVAGGVIKAIVVASRIAGTMGLGEALNQLLLLVEEARRQVRAASLQASILALLSAISLPVAVYSLGVLRSSLAMGSLNLVEPAVIDSMIKMIASTAPLIALPASVLQRGWLISPLYPLIAQALTMATLNIIA